MLSIIFFVTTLPAPIRLLSPITIPDIVAPYKSPSISYYVTSVFTFSDTAVCDRYSVIFTAGKDD